LFNDRSLFPPKPKADINNLFFGKNSAEVKPPVPVISPPPYNQKYDEDDLSNQVKDESKPAVDYRKLDVGVLPDSHSPNPIISNRATQVKGDLSDPYSFLHSKFLGVNYLRFVQNKVKWINRRVHLKKE